MRVLLLFLFMLSFSAKGSNDFSYADARLKHMPKNLQDRVMDTFSKFQLKRSFVGYRGSKLLGINMLFTDAFFVSKISLKYNIHGDYEFNKTYKFSNTYVYHFKLNNVPVAISYNEGSSSFIKKIISELKEIKITSLHFNFINKAHAECHSPDQLLTTVELDTTTGSQSAASMISDCFSEIGAGAEESTWGTVKSIGNGIADEWNLFWENPSKRAGEYWGYVESGIDKVWEFTKTVGEMIINPEYGIKVLKEKFGEIGTFFTQVYNNISSMPLESKVAMICNIIGSIGVDVLITAVTVGAGGGKLGITVARVLLKLKKISKLIGKGLKYPFKVLNELSEKVLEKINVIIKNGNQAILDKKLRRAGCAI